MGQRSELLFQSSDNRPTIFYSRVRTSEIRETWREMRRRDTKRDLMKEKNKISVTIFQGCPCTYSKGVQKYETTVYFFTVFHNELFSTEKR